MQSVVSVRPSVLLSVRLFPFYLLNRLTFELEILCVCHDQSSSGIKVIVKGQGQRGRCNLDPLSMAVFLVQTSDWVSRHMSSHDMVFHVADVSRSR